MGNELARVSDTTPAHRRKCDMTAEEMKKLDDFDSVGARYGGVLPSSGMLIPERRVLRILGDLSHDMTPCGEERGVVFATQLGVMWSRMGGSSNADVEKQALAAYGALFATRPAWACAEALDRLFKKCKFFPSGAEVDEALKQAMAGRAGARKFALETMRYIWPEVKKQEKKRVVGQTKAASLKARAVKGVSRESKRLPTPTRGQQAAHEKKRAFWRKQAASL